jgi:hypothetical protein
MYGSLDSDRERITWKAQPDPQVQPVQYTSEPTGEVIAPPRLRTTTSLPTPTGPRTHARVRPLSALLSASHLTPDQTWPGSYSIHQR